MSQPLDHEVIARAMKRAAWIAKHGTLEQRAGRFMPNVPKSDSGKDKRPDSEEK